MNRTSKLVTAARLVLGLIFLLSGVNHVIALVGLPPMTGATALFIEGLRQSGYFFPLLGMVEVIAGLMLLSMRMVPLALTVVAPIALNVALFHAVLAREAMPVVVLIVGAGIVLARHHRQAFAGLLRPHAAPASASLRAGELVLGLVFLLSGVLGFLGKTPPPSTAGAAVMMKGLAASGYFFPLLGAVQVVAGALLIVRRYVGLALLALAPLVVQILGYRLYVAAGAPKMVLIALALVALELWLAFAHRRFFASLLSSEAEPKQAWVPDPA
jgi:putative oxidoreductase